MKNRTIHARDKTILAAFSLLSVAGLGSVHAQSQQEERELPRFSKLRVQNGVDVYLRQADQQHLRIEVEGMDLEDVVTEVVDDELRISREGWGIGGFLRGSHVRAYLDFVQLSDIEASGGSDVEGRNTIEAEDLRIAVSGGSDVDIDVDAQQLDFTASGGSDLRVRGTTPSLTIGASGGSDVAARDLEASRASLRLSGGSDAAVRATEAIDIDASGGSDVTVYGDPATRNVDTDRSSDVDWN